jgi:uncharacterized protein DUF5666
LHRLAVTLAVAREPPKRLGIPMRKEDRPMLRIVVLILSTVVTLWVVACGGGYSSNSLSTPQSSGTTPVMTTAVITGFGSIFVGGVHFQTTSATIRKNGVPVSQSQLAVGEIARVKGNQDASGANGVAESVEVDENVVGPIDSLDTTNSIITVLGQTVKINTGTSFGGNIQPPGIAGLAAGQAVRVSGFVDSSGNIAATRIERTTSSTVMQVVGTVANLDSSAQIFMINGLTVSFAGASLHGFTSPQPTNGEVVEVQGTTFDATTVTLTATQVLREESDQEQAGDSRELEREGLITRFASATDFDVAGQPVTTTAATVFRNGTATDLALDMKVEVSGIVNSANVLVAQMVEFHHNGGFELQGQASAVNAAGGAITLLGVQITVTADTRFEDH